MRVDRGHVVAGRENGVVPPESSWRLVGEKGWSTAGQVEVSWGKGVVRWGPGVVWWSAGIQV